jgi:hypothetical protein
VNLPMQIISAISPVRAANLLTALQNDQVIKITTSLSYYIPGSQFYAIYGLTLFLFFYFSSAAMQSERNLKIVLWIIALIVGLESLQGILQSFFPDIGIFWLPGTMTPEKYPTGTFADHNHYAAFLNMCWPISLVLGLSLIKEIFEKLELLKIKNKKISITDWLQLMFHHTVLPLWCTTFTILAVILSRSASGIVIMFILVLLCRIVIPYPRLVKIIFSGVIYSALLLYGMALGIQGLTTRFTMFIHSAQTRFSFWADTLAMLRDHLYTGIGMGAYQFMAPFYIQAPADSILLRHIQNDYLELLLELGLPAAVLFFAWLLIELLTYTAIIYKMPRQMKKMTRDEIIIIGSFYALLGLILNAFVVNIFYSPAITFYAVAQLAILYSIMIRKNMLENYRPEYLFPQKKQVSFIPYRKPGRRRRR